MGGSWTSPIPLSSQNAPAGKLKPGQTVTLGPSLIIGGASNNTPPTMMEEWELTQISLAMASLSSGATISETRVAVRLLLDKMPVWEEEIQRSPVTLNAGTKWYGTNFFLGTSFQNPILFQHGKKLEVEATYQYITTEEVLAHLEVLSGYFSTLVENVVPGEASQRGSLSYDSNNLSGHRSL